MPSSNIFSRVQDMRTTLVDILSVVNKQINWFAAKDGEDVFFTMTGARISKKPFVIGFIPPENPVDFIPVEQVPSHIRRLPPELVVEDPPQPQGGGSLSVGRPLNLTPTRAGQQKQVAWQKRHFASSELRQAFASGYSNATGEQIPEPFLRHLMGQAQIESGCIAGNRCSVSNYNFGGVHFSGSEGRPANTCIRSSANPIEPFIPNPASGGSFAVSVDSRGQKGPCKDGNLCNGENPGRAANRTITTARDDAAGLNRCYYITGYRSHDTIEAGAEDMVRTALRIGGPAARDATTPEEYSKAICPRHYTGKGLCYHDPSKSTVQDYIDGINNSGVNYRKAFPDPIGGEAFTPAQEVARATNDDGVPAIQHRPVAMKTSDALETTTVIDDTFFDTGRNIQIAEQRHKNIQSQLKSLQLQIDIFQKIPPLVLLVNPQEITKTFERSIDDSNKGRQKNISHLWLERPMTLSVKGKTAAQYVTNAESSGGLTHHKRIHSLSYLNLMSLVETYKNNGMIYSGQGSGYSADNIGIPLLPMSIFIYYDHHLYIGSFDDFEISDSGDQPFNLNYSFKFNVRYDASALLSAGAQVTPPLETVIKSTTTRTGPESREVENEARARASRESAVRLQENIVRESDSTLSDEEVEEQAEENVSITTAEAVESSDSLNQITFPSDNKTTNQFQLWSRDNSLPPKIVTFDENDEVIL